MVSSQPVPLYWFEVSAGAQGAEPIAPRQAGGPRAVSRVGSRLSRPRECPVGARGSDSRHTPLVSRYSKSFTTKVHGALPRD